MSISIAIVGTQQVVKAIKREEERWLKAEAAAVYQWGLKLSNVSFKICPRDEGLLRASRYVTQPQKTRGGRFFVEVGYGASYATDVHERTEGSIQWTTAGTGPKFLERPYRRMRRGGVRWIAKQTKHNHKLGVFAKSITSDVPRRPKKDS